MGERGCQEEADLWYSEHWMDVSGPGSSPSLSLVLIIVPEGVSLLSCL